jgi:hypothetical protein
VLLYILYCFLSITLIILCLNLRDEKKYGNAGGKNGDAKKYGGAKNGGAATGVGVGVGVGAATGVGVKSGKNGKDGGAAGVAKFDAAEFSEETP